MSSEILDPTHDFYGSTQMRVSCLRCAEYEPEITNRSLLPPLYFILVGKGEPTPTKRYKDKYDAWRWSAGCGDITPGYICTGEKCGKVHYVMHACRKRECPDCWEGWKEEATIKIMGRLLCDTSKKIHNHSRLVHIILSPYDRTVPTSKEELNKKIRDGYKYILEHGALGGAAVFHPFRTKKEVHKLAYDDDLKYWDWIREQEDPCNFYYYSDHLHLICYIRWMKRPLFFTDQMKLNDSVNYLCKSGDISGDEKILYTIQKINNVTKEQVEREKRWNYKTIEKKDDNDFLHVAEFQNDIVGLHKVINYQLSHTCVLMNENESFDSVRWFGSCSRNKFKTDMLESEEEEKEPLVCKICGAKLMPFWRWIYTYYFDLLQGGIEPLEYEDEIINLKNGDPPPKDAIAFLV